jgi:hypothetical protein
VVETTDRGFVGSVVNHREHEKAFEPRMTRMARMGRESRPSARYPWYPCNPWLKRRTR